MVIVMEKEELQKELSLLLIRASLRGKFEISEAVESHGITFTQAATLCLLDPGKPLPMNALSTFLGCAPSNITGIIDRLVVSSYVTREEWTKDRRVKTISLTDKGVALRADLLKIAMEARLPGINTLSTTKLRDTLQILNDITPSIQSVL